MDNMENKRDIEYIRIVWVDACSEEGDRMLNYDGNSADIVFRYKKLHKAPLTEIRVIKNVATAELLAHEFGHFIQYALEEKGFTFQHDEEMSFYLEDCMRDFIRKKLYNLEGEDGSKR
jgi:hypothetical protein